MDERTASQRTNNHGRTRQMSTNKVNMAMPIKCAWAHGILEGLNVDSEDIPFGGPVVLAKREAAEAASGNEPSSSIISYVVRAVHRHCHTVLQARRATPCYDRPGAPQVRQGCVRMAW